MAVRLGPQGRIVIPAEFRRAMGLAPGEPLVAWLEGDRLVVRARRRVEQDLWARFEGLAPQVEALIRERRDEAAREAEG